jgi:hypothetical protein
VARRPAADGRGRPGRSDQRRPDLAGGWSTGDVAQALAFAAIGGPVPVTAADAELISAELIADGLDRTCCEVSKSSTRL